MDFCHFIILLGDCVCDVCALHGSRNAFRLGVNVMRFFRFSRTVWEAESIPNPYTDMICECVANHIDNTEQ